MKTVALTSGGEAPDMNAALRAGVRTLGLRPTLGVGIEASYKGLLEGWFRSLDNREVGGTLHRGETVPRTARST